MTAANVDHTNLDNQAYGGIVREDVLEQIFLLDDWRPVLTGMCSKGTHQNRYWEFTHDTIGTGATDNAFIDGQDLDQNDAVLTNRLGSTTQISAKEIQISHSAESSNSIGNAGSMSYQIRRANQRLRRDVEAQMCSTQAGVLGDGTTTAGISPGIGAWISSNVNFGVGGSAGGFNDTTGIVDAPTQGTARPVTFDMIKDMAEMIYKAGGDCRYLMGTPRMIRLISEYCFSTGARIATQTNDNTSGTSPMTGYGSTNVLVLDHGQVIELIPNRDQPEVATDVSNLYFLDPKHLRQSFLRGYRVEPLAKTGLSEKRMISCEYSLAVLDEESCGMIADCDETAAVT